MKIKNQVWKDTLEIIKKNGWRVQPVLGSKESPSFAYTIGLSDKGLPELLVAGLHPSKANYVLDLVGKGLIDQTFHGSDGETIDGVFTVPLKFRELHFQDVQNVMLGAIRYMADPKKPMTFLQVLFPDANGYYPGDPQCQNEYSMMQSLAGIK
jgi:hypothetical protein